MQKKSERTSIIVSMILTVLLFLALCALACCLPMVVRAMIDTTDNIGDRASITLTERALVLVDAYAMVAIALIAVILLYLLLRRVLHGQVFSEHCVALIASVSWCCFAEALLFLLIGGFFSWRSVSPLRHAVSVFACASSRTSLPRQPASRQKTTIRSEVTA